MYVKIKDWDVGFYDTTGKKFYCDHCLSAFEYVNDLKKHFIENGFIL